MLQKLAILVTFQIVQMLSGRSSLRKALQRCWGEGIVPGIRTRRQVSFLTPLGSAFNTRPSSKLNLMGEKFSQNRTGLFGFPGMLLINYLGASKIRPSENEKKFCPRKTGHLE